MNRPNKLVWVCLHKPFKSSAIKHTSLMGPFVRYEENEVLRKLIQGSMLQNFFPAVNYEFS